MIQHLDNLLRDLFISQIASLSNDNQVQFRPPDSDWRTEVANLNGPALNIFLLDIRENRKLRSNARVPDGLVNGSMQRQVAPMRLDCHYLITAWSAAQHTPAIEPALDNHELLYEATAVLANHTPLNPARIYAPGSVELLDVPAVIREADLPTHLLPPEGFAKLSDFWGTMGATERWQPGIYLIVTLPVVLENEIAGPMVTTLVTEYRHKDNPAMSEVRIAIGGHVYDSSAAPATAVPEAWVQLEQPDGTPVQATQTDADGRFQFGYLTAGSYQLQWRATGFPLPAAPRPIEIPSPSGEYDLLL